MEHKCPKCGKVLSLYVSDITGFAEWICECNDTFLPDGKFTPHGHIIALSMFAKKVI